MVLVTDIKRTVYKGDKKKEKEITGFYMDGYLMKNLNPIPQFLKKSWDCVGIVSGRGKVRVGKSTMAAQVCYYLAWLLAGGQMEVDDKNKILEVKKPTSPVRFNLKENVVFSAEQLQSQAMALYEKYGKNQVIMYDEGRQGLESARTMESLNKGMEDFFQECGFMGHVIIIVLPNYFKLHEDYAVARSIFLIDVFADKNFSRGYFNFYNERQKEYLYFFGKKRVGVTAKYMATNESFWGRFTQWLPFNKEEYDEIKKSAINKKRRTRTERNLLLMRNILIWLLVKRGKWKNNEISKAMKADWDFDFSTDRIQHIISDMNEIKLKEKGF
ncbi:MAG TPA: hypothetical protein VMZ91_00145 [Candidatus Paceibacterota bacterium]|nr:hypothetical protein [Candidatus Paceibacterota bacterium]